MTESPESPVEAQDRDSLQASFGKARQPREQDAAGPAEPRAGAEDTASPVASVAQAAKEDLGSLVGQLRQWARSAADRQKTALADQIGDVAHSLHTSAQQIANDTPFTAEIMTDGAARLDRVSASIRERDVADVIDGAARFGYEHPVVLFGAATAVGIAVSRVLATAPGERAADGRTRED